MRGKVQVALVRVDDLLRVGALVDSADEQAIAPDLSHEAPDLMRLFRAATARVKERPLPRPREKQARPDDRALMDSLRRNSG